jgi:steroid 5-alpha reductase family enzyme
VSVWCADVKHVLLFPSFFLRGQLFNFSFISIFQHVLIFGFSSPVAVAAVTSRGAADTLNNVDFLAIAVSVGALIGETVADQQQWAFQQAKYGKAPRQAALAGDYKRGFLSSQLFAYSRHPNFVRALLCLFDSSLYVNAPVAHDGMVVCARRERFGTAVLRDVLLGRHLAVRRCEHRQLDREERPGHVHAHPELQRVDGVLRGPLRSQVPRVRCVSGGRLAPHSLVAEEAKVGLRKQSNS